MPTRGAFDRESAWLAAVCGSKVLLARRACDPVGEWNFPGGKIERGEEPIVAVAREAFEEVGLAVQPSQITKVAELYSKAWKKNLHYFVAAFPEEFVPTLNHEHDAWGWFPATAFPKPLHKSVRLFPFSRLETASDVTTINPLQTLLKLNDDEHTEPLEYKQAKGRQKWKKRRPNVVYFTKEIGKDQSRHVMQINDAEIARVDVKGKSIVSIIVADPYRGKGMENLLLAYVMEAKDSPQKVHKRVPITASSMKTFGLVRP